MTQGRRAADRRRQRGGDSDHEDDDAGPGTAPGSAPVVPHDNYVEDHDESRAGGMPLLSADGSAEGLAEVSAVLLRDTRGEGRNERSTSTPGAGQPPRRLSSPSSSSSSAAPAAAGAARGAAVRGHLVDEEPADADKSFARELKRRPPAPGRDTQALQRPEATEVREYKAPRRARRGGSLVVVVRDAGSLKVGTVLPIALTPSLLGRAHGADLRLDDPTVSLRHAELSWDKDAGTFSVTDLGSRSGTLRNGEAIDGRVDLVHGDVIAVGKTELRFLKSEALPVDKPPELAPEAAAASPVVVEIAESVVERSAERTSPNVKAAREAAARAEAEALQVRRQSVRRRAWWVIGASASLLLAVGAVTLGYREAFSDVAPAQIRHQVSVLLGEAKKYLNEGDVDAAHARVQTVLGLDVNNAEAHSLDRVVSTEKGSRDALQLALRLGDEDRDDEALQALTRIADTSVFSKDRDRLRSSLASRALIRSLRLVEGLLDQGRIDDALARVEDHLKRFPGDPGGLALMARVKDSKGLAPRNPALLPARQAFADGRLDDARRLAEGAGYAGYAADVDRFARSLADGKAALARFDGAVAKGPLDEAFRLLGSLGASATSPTFLTVQKPYADALYLTGTEKLEAGDGCGAARDLFKAARVLPGDARLQAELQRLQTLADQGLQKARGTRSQDPERAASLAREHLCFARSGSSTWEDLAAIAR